MSLIATAAIAQNPKTLSPLIPRSDFDIPEGSNQYPYTTGTITKLGYTYKYRNYKFIDVEVPLVLELYNAANPYLDVEWKHKDGSALTPEEKLGKRNDVYFSHSSQTVDQTLAMVNGLFTSEQKTMLKGKLMMIFLRIDSSTGKIADVYFSFRRDYPFVNIPVETYRSIELALKQNFTFTTTAQGRKMNYLQLFWEQEF